MKSWTSEQIGRIDDLHKLHNPRVYSDAFGLKKPLAFCANEDCAYRNEAFCPAGSGKKACPNRSKLDYKNGCTFFVGRPFQNDVLSRSMDGTKPVTVMITGRGTGKSAIINTQKALMEATVEPYIRAKLMGCDRPIPTKIIVVGNTKDTALLLRNAIHNALESSELLYSMVSDDTKTYVKFYNGSEIFIRTAGTDGRTCRGFHADVIKDSSGNEFRGTILFLIDEACFLRANSFINDVVLPSLQNGNIFSGIFITSTPWGKSGEIYDMCQNPGASVRFYNFASYHNKYTSLKILNDFRERLKKAGAASIFNREVLGLFQSEEGLFFPWVVWSQSLDESLDWLEYSEIEVLAKKDVQYVGDYYLGLDPNRFRQLEEGDFAAYLLVQVSKNREHVRAISHGKYLMDIGDKYKQRIDCIKKVFNPKKIICCGNSGYLTDLKNAGIDVIPGSNETGQLYRSMALAKIDMVHGVYKQPPGQLFEDERRSYIPKERDVSSIPRLDHKGRWGGGYTSDLMDCLSFIYQQIIEDFGLGTIPVPEASGLSVGYNTPFALGEYESLVMSTAHRMDLIRR
jgi:hypothetical protein